MVPERDDTTSQKRASISNADDELGETPGDTASAASVGNAAISKWALVTAVLIMLIVINIQPPATDIDMNGDTSWGAVLNYAHAHGWQFGRDIVHTYGPLGFLTLFYYSEHAVWARLATDVLICFAVSAGLCQVAWKLPVWRRSLLLALFVFGASNLEPRTDLLLNTGLFCWGLLCFVDSGQRLIVSLVAFIALAVFSGLAKISYLALGGLTVLVLSAYMLTKRRPFLSITSFSAYAVGLVCAWMAAGQKLANFRAFLAHSFEVVRAYNRALGWEGLPAVRQTGFMLAALVTLLIALGAWTARLAEGENGSEHSTSNQEWSSALKTMTMRGLLFGWLMFITFAFWKHAFVREDFQHTPYFLAFMPVLGLGLGIVPGHSRRADWCGLSLGIASCGLALGVLQWLYLPSLSRSIPEPAHALAYHIRCLVNPNRYVREMDAATQALRSSAQLPEFRKIIGGSSVDFFGYNQIYILFNELNYRPAPLIQSFMACDEKLARLNEGFYLSPAAPEYVVFTLASPDRKFPPLDDGRLLRALLFNYELAGKEGRFLLLRKKSIEAPKLTLLKQGVIEASQPIDLRSYQSLDLWLDIDMKPSLIGRMRQILYRAPTVRLASWREPQIGLLDRRRSPPSNLAAGFVASPLLVRTESVEALFGGKEETRPGAYSVELGTNDERWWERSIRYRVYSIQRGP